MGIATLPAAAGGGIKSVQRGSAGGAGTVTITAVDIAKSFVNVQGTAASGTVAAAGSINASTTNFAQVRLLTQNSYFNTFNTANGNVPASGSVNLWIPAQTMSSNATNLGGGSTNIVAAQVTGFLSNSTSLVVSAACRYEVVEFA